MIDATSLKENKVMGNDNLVALFANSGDAQQSIVRLFNIGLPAENIGFLEPADVRGRNSARKRAAASTVLSAIALGIAGGVLGASLIGLSNLVGAALAATVGVGFGGYAGAILGSFFGTDGVADDEAYFIREIRAGRTLVVASLPDWAAEERAAAVLHACNALSVDSLSGGSLPPTLRHPSGRTMLAALEAREVATEPKVA